MLEQEADRAAAAGDFVAARRLLEEALADGTAGYNQWMKLCAMRKAVGDLHGAVAAVDRALALSPLDFPALLSRALMLEKLRPGTAGQDCGNALAQRPSEISPAMQSAVQHAELQWRVHQEALEANLSKHLPPTLSPLDREQAERFISNRVRRTRHYHQEPSDFHYPGLPELEFHDRRLFPALAELEDEAEAIRSEFNALIAAEAAEIVPYIQYPERVPLRQWRELNFSRNWTAIHLLQNGLPLEANARHCPRTMAVLSSMPQPIVSGTSPNAMFSLLAPRTRIPAHTGVANTRVVCHLPLIVPPGCGFRVGETVREWKVGEAFVFDDTIEHEAWNESDELRVVLIIDLWPPALSAEAREVISAVIGAYGVAFSGV